MEQGARIPLRLGLIVRTEPDLPRQGPQIFQVLGPVLVQYSSWSLIICYGGQTITQLIDGRKLETVCPPRPGNDHQVIRQIPLADQRLKSTQQLTESVRMPTPLPELCLGLELMGLVSIQTR